MTFSRRILLVSAAVALILVAVAGREPLRLGFLVVAGRSPHCPLQRAVLVTANQRRLTAIKDRFVAGSQLVEKGADGLELWDTPDGRYWIPDNDPFFLAFNLAEQEHGIYSLGGVAVQPGDVVLDCGASVGIFTRRALAAGAEHVVAIEPSPENIECLRRNLAEEIDAGKVTLYPKGVWDTEENLTLYVEPGNAAAASFLRRTPDWEPVGVLPLTTIDRLVSDLEIERVDFVKMDIEGAEARAIRGAWRTLTRHRPRLAIASYHAADHPVTIPRAVFAAAPSYRMRCGYCSEASGRIRPDVLLFQ